MQGEVKKITRGTYENKATGYKADITAKTINKIMNPSNNPKFNPWRYNYLDNLNAAVKLPELFENAVYVDTKGNHKDKNNKKQINGFHHFVATIRMDGKGYRAKINAREKANSDTLHIVDTELLPMKKGAAVPNNKNGNISATPSAISISDLVNGVNIYDYDIKLSNNQLIAEYLDKQGSTLSNP